MGAQAESTTAGEAAGGRLIQQAKREAWQEKIPGVPEPVAGKVNDWEAIAQPKVRELMADAWNESMRVAAETGSSAKAERGGWIMERSSWIEKALFGKYYVSEFKVIDGTQMMSTPVPKNGDYVVGAFHTHPGGGDGARASVRGQWAASASPGDWAAFGNKGVTRPHYILSHQGVYRLTHVQSYLGPLRQFIGTPSPGCGRSVR